jgi:hypothetical protein
MLHENPINCICGQKPELKIRPIWGEGGVDYYFYECSKCEISTFASRKEEYCRETWGATIKRKLELLK